MCHLCIILKGSPVWWEVVGGRKNNVVWLNEGEPCILARVEEMIDLSNNIPEIFILNKVSYWEASCDWRSQSFLPYALV